jgi:teichuronic acid exporter
MEKTLKEKTTSALIWSFIDKFGQQIIYLVTGIVLGRILSPHDYGLLGSLLFFIAISTVLIGSGYNRALINKKDVTPAELNALYLYCSGMGVLLYIVLFFAAPLIGLFFKQPSLVLYSRVLFLSIIFNSVIIIPGALLTMKMDLNGLAKANMFSLIPASIFAVLAVVNGYGVWALIIQNVLFAFFKAIFYNYYSKFKLSRSFNFKVLKDLLSFSSKVLIINLITTTFNNVYYILIGRFYGITQLGFYTQANKYQEIPTTIISQTFRSVSMPLLSGINDDEFRMKRVLSKMIQTIAFVGLPVMIGMILIAKPLFIVLITEKWLTSVPVFQILCVAGMFVIFNSVIEESVLSKGRSGALLVFEIIKRCILVLSIFLTIKFGLIALAIGWGISWFIALILTLYLSKRFLKYSIIDFIKDCFPYFIITLALCGIAYFISGFISNYLINICFCIAFVAPSYFIICRVFKLQAAIETYDWIGKKIKLYKR